MTTRLTAALALPLLLMTGVAAADEDLEGRITALDPSRGVLVVEGVAVHTGPGTDYDDGLRGFGDLRVGQRVEVDYVLRDGVRHATEIELDD